ncbi:MAG: hypothetical protein WBB01_22220 [Phormidesmis sp.]
MGKQNIDQLLAQLKDNQRQDVQNAAAIFTVAQGAVNQLSQLEPQTEAGAKPTALSDQPPRLTKADLIERYGSYNHCRKAAKQLGITFSKNPRWEQLVAAFGYLPACQSCVDAYMQRHPHPDIKGIKIQLTL